MPAQLTRCDSLREYLTGALTLGGAQASPLLSFGNHRSDTEALSMGILITSPISGLSVTFASGANPAGAGTLACVDGGTLAWKPFGASVAGPTVGFLGGISTSAILEARDNPGQYLRVSGTAPFPVGSSTVTLSQLVNNVFGFGNVSIATSVSGDDDYLATILVNSSANIVTEYKRWIAEIGTSQVTNGSFLPDTGAGQIITDGTFADWPSAGWAQIRSSLGILKEVVYYTSRTNTILVIPSVGRGLFGLGSLSGDPTDRIHSVPGVVLAINNTGVTVGGLAIQAIANINTPPTGVTWNFGITAATGLQIGNLQPGSQVGIWMWRQLPPNTISDPLSLTKFSESFNAF